MLVATTEHARGLGIGVTALYSRLDQLRLPCIAG